MHRRGSEEEATNAEPLRQFPMLKTIPETARGQAVFGGNKLDGTAGSSQARGSCAAKGGKACGTFLALRPVRLSVDISSSPQSRNRTHSIEPCDQLRAELRGGSENSRLKLESPPGFRTRRIPVLQRAAVVRGHDPILDIHLRCRGTGTAGVPRHGENISQPYGSGRGLGA